MDSLTSAPLCYWGLGCETTSVSGLEDTLRPSHTVQRPAALTSLCKRSTMRVWPCLTTLTNDLTKDLKRTSLTSAPLCYRETWVWNHFSFWPRGHVAPLSHGTKTCSLDRFMQEEHNEGLAVSDDSDQWPNQRLKKNIINIIILS